MARIMKVKRIGLASQPDTFEKAIRKLVQQRSRDAISGVTALTNSAGGTPGTVITRVADVVGAANSGSNLADKTTSEAAFTTVKDALLELYTKANALAAITGSDAVTYNGGGTSADGTVGAITVSVTGAATGILVANTNTFLDALNSSVYNCAVLCNRLARATGNTELTFSGFTGTNAESVLATVPAITIAGGTAASPGVTKAEADAALVAFRTNITSMAAFLNSLISTQTALIAAV